MTLGDAESAQADETTGEYLDIVSAEIRKADKIVSDLLDFSRTRPVERKEILVSDLVAQVLERRPLPNSVNAIVELPDELSSVLVDPRQMEQVLVNLLDNACQAMPEGGRVVLSAQAEQDDVALSITDTGCGIPEENIKKLFEPLFTTKARGIGLGLAVSKNLMEANGGSIEVTSEEGKGSTFTVRLPTKEAVP
jgi:signal transduction histidine kinase